MKILKNTITRPQNTKQCYCCVHTSNKRIFFLHVPTVVNFLLHWSTQKICRFFPKPKRQTKSIWLFWRAKRQYKIFLSLRRYLSVTNPRSWHDHFWMLVHGWCMWCAHCNYKTFSECPFFAFHDVIFTVMITLSAFFPIHTVFLPVVYTV